MVVPDHSLLLLADGVELCIFVRGYEREDPNEDGIDWLDAEVSVRVSAPGAAILQCPCAMCARDLTALDATLGSILRRRVGGVSREVTWETADGELELRFTSYDGEFIVSGEVKSQCGAVAVEGRLDRLPVKADALRQFRAQVARAVERFPDRLSPR